MQRLAKWFTTLSPKDKAKIIKDVSQLVLARRTRMCNFLEYKGTPVSSASADGHPPPKLHNHAQRRSFRKSNLNLPLP